MTANSNAPMDTSIIMAERSAINKKSFANHFERSTARRRRDGGGGGGGGGGAGGPPPLPPPLHPLVVHTSCASDTKIDLVSRWNICF